MRNFDVLAQLIGIDGFDEKIGVCSVAITYIIFEFRYNSNGNKMEAKNLDIKKELTQIHTMLGSMLESCNDLLRD